MHNADLVRADWSIRPCFGSNHLPVLVWVEFGVECIKSSKSIPRRNWKAANLDAFRDEVEVAVTDIAADLQVATLKGRVSTLVEVIAAGDSHHIPRIRPRDKASKLFEEATSDQTRRVAAQLSDNPPSDK